MARVRAPLTLALPDPVLASADFRNLAALGDPWEAAEARAARPADSGANRSPTSESRAIAAYLLLGLSWASTYELVALNHPGAFTGAVAAETGLRPLVYYSFVTLTTMGYGDITPMHPIARSLAVMQALAGQLYEEESRAYVQIYLDWLRRSLAPG